MAQKQLQITYENFTYNLTNIVSSKVDLVVTRDACLSTTEDHWMGQCINIIKNPDGTKGAEIGEVDKFYSYHVFKDFKENTLYYFEEKAYDLHVKEVLNQFKWELTQEKKEILGYMCTKAKTKYRGRDYTAWFTTDLPYKAAPWKFHGLPGVSLSIQSDDGYLKMTAVSLKITNGEEPKNPFAKEKFISWDEFVNIYKKDKSTKVEQFKANNARIGSTFSGGFNSPRIEVILPCNRLDTHSKNLWGKRVKEGGVGKKPQMSQKEINAIENMKFK
jgi:GLPGLI family protein